MSVRAATERPLTLIQVFQGKGEQVAAALDLQQTPDGRLFFMKESGNSKGFPP